MKFQNSNKYLLSLGHSQSKNKIVNNSIQKIQKSQKEQIIVNKNKAELNLKLFQQEKPDKIKRVKNQKPKNTNFFRVFLIVSFILTILGGYLITKDILLNIDRQLLLNCVEKERCPTRIKAIENFVKAKKSLKIFNFYGIDLKYSDLKSANFFKTDLRYADLKYSELKYADLRYADLRYADLRYADLRHADLRYADLRHADLRYADLTHVDLRYTDIRHSYLVKADLRDSNLENADLRYTNLKNADLRYTNLKNTNLKYSNLEKANLIKSIALTPSQVKVACQWEKAIYIDYYNMGNKKWMVNNKANQIYIEQLKEAKDSDLEESKYCDQIIFNNP